MIDIYYCKFFTIKHRGLHTVYLTHSFVYTVHTASRDNRPVYTGTWCMVHYIYMCLYCGIFPTVEQKKFFSQIGQNSDVNRQCSWQLEHAYYRYSWHVKDRTVAWRGGGHEEPLHVVANFYFSKQTFLCVKITDRTQKIILNELTLPLAFDGQCLQYRRTCEDKNIMIYISHNLTI